jgi:hypothetical protein
MLSVTDSQEAHDWYCGFRRWAPSREGESVVSMRPLLAEMLGAGVVAADSEVAEWKGGGGHPSWDVSGDGGSCRRQSSHGITGMACSGSLLRRRQASMTRTKCMKSSLWCSTVSSSTMSTFLMEP